MVRSLSLSILTLIAVLGVTGCLNQDDKKSLVVAKVAERTLSSEEFAKKLAFRLKEFDALAIKNESQLNQVKEEIIQNFIVDTVSQVWAEKNNIIVTESEIEDHIKRVREIYPDEYAFRRSLNQEHITMNSWRHGLKKSILQKKIVSAVQSDLSEVSDDEVKRYYETNKNQFHHGDQIMIQQIVVKKREQAENLLSHIKKEGDIAQVAKKYSISPEAENGGVTDWIDTDTLEIFKKAYLLPKNGSPKIMSSPFGYHIIKVLKKRKGGSTPLKVARNKIRTLIIQNREQEAYSRWLDKQLRQHKFYKDEKLIASISVETKDH